MERKIKIIHLAQALGGVDTSIRSIIENLDEDNFEVVLIRDAEKELKPVKYKSGKIVVTHKINFQREINPLNDFKFLKEAIRIVKSEKPGLIHCHSAKGGIIGRTVGQLLKIPTFFTPQAFSYLSTQNKVKKNAYKLIERLYSQTNSFLIACSRSEANNGIIDVHYPKNRVYVVNNAIKCPEQMPDFNLDSDYICTIGRPSFQKNSLYLLKVFKELNKRVPHIKLYLLGVGHYSPDLAIIKNFIHRNSLQESVKLYDWAPREKTLEILKNSLFYMSFARYEGLPFAVLEAMAAGKACILSDADGNRDCLKDRETGLLFDLNCPPPIVASKIESLLNNKEQLLQFGKKAYQYFIENFLIEKNIKMLERLYTTHAKTN